MQKLTLDKKACRVHFGGIVKSSDKLTVRFRDARELDMIRKAADVEERSLNYFVVKAAREMAQSVLRRNGKTPRKLKTPV